MYDQLPILLQLQEIDDEIDKLEIEKAKTPAELQALEAELTKHRTAFQNTSEGLEKLQRERRSKDRQLDTQQAQLEKYKSQRLSVKTNKEYTALESEIADLEMLNSNIEDEILELMISTDDAGDVIEAARKKLEAQEAVFGEKREEFLSEIRKLDRQISKWNKKRKVFLEKISSEIMDRYNSWRKRRGTSLVAVIKGRSCGGCNLNLPLQLVNEVRKAQELHICNSCGRILYWQDEEDTVIEE